jgi:hypothetical protein
MGLIEDTFLGMARDAAEDIAGERARHTIPRGTGAALGLLATLLAWIFAAGLVITGLMWMASGAIPQGLGAAALGGAMLWLFTRPARSSRRG